MVSSDVFAATYANPRALNVGDTYELRRDGWSTPPGGALYDGDVLPKTDANDGLNRDNPYYRRHNVARAWPTDMGYWFTAADRNEGEPDPAGEQWVDYTPPFEVLGAGLYAIDASYRWSAGRASYPAVYRVHHALGTNEVLRDQRIGTSAATSIYFSPGEFEMRPGSFVRVEDTGSESITFAHMRFRLVRPAPRLSVALEDGWFVTVSWPANADPCRLEYTLELGPDREWFPYYDDPVMEGEEWVMRIAPWDSSMYLRLAIPAP